MTIRSKWNASCLFAARQVAVCSMSGVLLSLLVAGGAAATAAVTVLITVHNLFSATAISITETFFFTIHFVRAFAFEMGTVKFIPFFRCLAVSRVANKSAHFEPLATHTHTRMICTHK